MPNSRDIVETSFTVVNSDDGASRKRPGLPPVGGGHPAPSPDGRLIVTDTRMDRFGGEKNHWGILLADATGGGSHLMLYSFRNNAGARSWRRSHPHPVFSADGRRIYFNVSDGKWTRLFVAERER
jgi:Tol biopolymer transport system component